MSKSDLVYVISNTIPEVSFSEHRMSLTAYPSVQKCILKTPWRPVLKTGLQDGCEDLKTFTDPSYWSILNVLKTSMLDALQSKLNVPFKTSIQFVLKTTTAGSSKRQYNG